VKKLIIVHQIVKESLGTQELHGLCIIYHSSIELGATLLGFADRQMARGGTFHGCALSSSLTRRNSCARNVTKKHIGFLQEAWFLTLSPKSSYT
jgi:hypothetical protein